jgi:hypothetical protein
MRNELRLSDRELLERIAEDVRAMRRSIGIILIVTGLAGIAWRFLQ